jgi:hypothetical protein
MSALEKIKEEVAKIMQGNNHWIDRKHFNEDMQQSPATELFWKEVINRYASESVKEYKEKLKAGLLTFEEHPESGDYVLGFNEGIETAKKLIDGSGE